MRSISIDDLERQFFVGFFAQIYEEFAISEYDLEFFAEQFVNEIRGKFCQYFTLNTNIAAGTTDAVNFTFDKDKFTRDFTMFAEQIVFGFEFER